MPTDKMGKKSNSKRDGSGPKQGLSSGPANRKKPATRQQPLDSGGSGGSSKNDQ